MRIASVHLLHLLASETSINKKEKAMSYNQESKNSMTLKEFGDKFINDVNPIVDTNPYLAFFIMSAALEFISRCKACLPNFHKKDGSSDRYVKAINNIKALKPYRIFNRQTIYKTKNGKYKKKNTNDLYSVIRCGLLHAGMPNEGLTLSSELNELENKVVGCKSLYADIRNAWQELKSNTKVLSYLESTNALTISNELPEFKKEKE